MSTTIVRRLLAALLLAVAASAAAAGPVRIDVFVAPGAALAVPAELRTALAAAGVEVTVWDLGGLERLREQLRAGLPSPQAGMDAVRAAARRRVEALDPASLQAESRSAAEGAALARSAGVQKLPAVVFDLGSAQATAVYGIDNLGTALAYERAWRERAR